MNPVEWPEHLRDDAPYVTCTKCGRKVWDRDGWGRRCGMRQPVGSVCDGVIAEEKSP